MAGTFLSLIDRKSVDAIADDVLRGKRESALDKFVTVATNIACNVPGLAPVVAAFARTWMSSPADHRLDQQIAAWREDLDRAALVERIAHTLEAVLLKAAEDTRGLDISNSETLIQLSNKLERHQSEIIEAIERFNSKHDANTGKVATSDHPKEEITIASIARVASDDENVIGYAIVVHNSLNEEVYANAIDFSGSLTTAVHGAGAALERVVYHVVLDAVPVGPSEMKVSGRVYLGTDRELGLRCIGGLLSELDTKKSEMRREYFFRIPVAVHVSPRSGTEIVVRFRRNTRTQVERTVTGGTSGIFDPGIVIQDRHTVRMLLDGERFVEHTMGLEFLDFVLRRDTLSAEQGEALELAREWSELIANLCVPLTGESRKDRLERLGLALRTYDGFVATCLEKVPQDRRNEFSGLAETIAAIKKETDDENDRM